MLQPCAAARRFYHAFYQWNVLSSTPHHGARGLTIRIHPVRHRKQPPPVVRPPKSWWAHTPKSAVDLPVTRLSLFEEAIRSRSDTHIVIETSIPQNDLAELRARYGEDLVGLAEQTGAKVEVGGDGSFYQEDGEIYTATAVTYSGSFEQCSAVRSEYRAVKDKRKMARIEREGDPWNDREPQLVRKTFSNRSALNVRRPDSDIEKAERSWTSYPVLSESDVSRDHMQPFFFVVRHRSEVDNSYTVEFSIPIRAWKRIVALIPLRQIQIYCEADVVVESVHRSLGKKYIVSIRGTLAQTDRSVKLFSGLFARLQEQNEARRAELDAVPIDEAVRPSLPPDAPLLSSTTSDTKSWEEWITTKDDAQSVSGSSGSIFRYTHVSPTVTASNRAQGAREPLINQSAKSSAEPTAGIWGQPGSIGQRAYSTRTKQTLPRPYRSSDPSQLSDDLKRAFRPLTHPVALITSRISQQGQSDGDLNDCRGVTVSSFNTVTMSPTPIVSFNLRVPSRSWDAILSLRRMTIHLLSATSKGAAVAHAFTQPYEQPGEPFLRLRSLGVAVDEPLSTTSKANHHGPPRLTWDDAVIAQIDAQLLEHKSVDLGDHVVIFAEVVGLSLPYDSTANGQGELAVDRSEGLAYALRGFRGVGANIEPVELPDLRKAEDRKVNHAATTKEPAFGMERRDSHSLGHNVRSYATWSSIDGQQRRSYSSSFRPFFDSAKDALPKDIGGRRSLEMVNDPALLSTTVDDFLGIPYRPSGRGRRMRGLVRAQNAAREASQQLETKLADGSLTAEESTALEDTVTRNERHVAKTLALRSAQDLQRMLDNGKVDSRRVQWIESSVEKGQAVLLEEARQLRRMLDEKTITLEQFEVVKTKLEQENTLLDTELRRLRQLMDDD